MIYSFLANHKVPIKQFSKSISIFEPLCMSILHPVFETAIHSAHAITHICRLEDMDQLGRTFSIHN